MIKIKNEIAIGTSDGILILDDVQPAGKKPMSAISFVNGNPSFVGAHLKTSEVSKTSEVFCLSSEIFRLGHRRVNDLKIICAHKPHAQIVCERSAGVDRVIRTKGLGAPIAITRRTFAVRVKGQLRARYADDDLGDVVGRRQIRPCANPITVDRSLMKIVGVAASHRAQRSR